MASDRAYNYVQETKIYRALLPYLLGEEELEQGYFSDTVGKKPITDTLKNLYRPNNYLLNLLNPMFKIAEIYNKKFNGKNGIKSIFENEDITYYQTFENLEYKDRETNKLINLEKVVKQDNPKTVKGIQKHKLGCIFVEELGKYFFPAKIKIIIAPNPKADLHKIIEKISKDYKSIENALTHNNANNMYFVMGDNLAIAEWYSLIIHNIFVECKTQANNSIKGAINCYKFNSNNFKNTSLDIDKTELLGKKFLHYHGGLLPYPNIWNEVFLTDTQRKYVDFMAVEELNGGTIYEWQEQTVKYNFDKKTRLGFLLFRGDFSEELKRHFASFDKPIQIIRAEKNPEYILASKNKDVNKSIFGGNGVITPHITTSLKEFKNKNSKECKYFDIHIKGNYNALCKIKFYQPKDLKSKRDFDVIDRHIIETVLSICENSSCPVTIPLTQFYSLYMKNPKLQNKQINIEDMADIKKRLEEMALTKMNIVVELLSKSTEKKYKKLEQSLENSLLNMLQIDFVLARRGNQELECVTIHSQPPLYASVLKQVREIETYKLDRLLPANINQHTHNKGKLLDKPYTNNAINSMLAEINMRILEIIDKRYNKKKLVNYSTINLMGKIESSTIDYKKLTPNQRTRLKNQIEKNIKEICEREGYTAFEIIRTRNEFKAIFKK